MGLDRPIRILLVDDHVVVRQGFEALLALQDDFVVVGQAGTGTEGIVQWKAHRPDVTLMDLALPDMDGVEAVRAIHAFCPQARVIVLTTYESDERILSAARSGARTYLIKTVQPRDLYQAIRGVARDVPFGFTRRPSIPPRRPDDTLTDRELTVLVLLGRGQSNCEIADALSVSVNTIKTHVRAVLHKLGVKSRSAAVANAIARRIIESPTPHTES